MKLNGLLVNSSRLEQGAWVGDIPEMGNLRLNVRGFGNREDKRIQAREIEKQPRALRARGKISDEAQDAIMNARLKGAILLGWDGLEAEDGSPVVMTPELVDTILTNPDYGKLRIAIIWAASIVAEDEEEGAKVDAKN